MESVKWSAVVVMLGGCMVDTAGAPGSRTTPTVSTATAGSEQSPTREPTVGAQNEVVIPRLDHLSVVQAMQMLRRAGVTGRIDAAAFTSSDSSAAVCSSSPGAGSKTLDHLTVVLEPCDDDADAPVGDDTPDLRGMTVDAATKLIRDLRYAGPVVVRPIAEFRGACAVDRICRVYPLHWAVAAGQLELFVMQRPN